MTRIKHIFCKKNVADFYYKLIESNPDNNNTSTIAHSIANLEIIAFIMLSSSNQRVVDMSSNVFRTINDLRNSNFPTSQYKLLTLQLERSLPPFTRRKIISDCLRTIPEPSDAMQHSFQVLFAYWLSLIHKISQTIFMVYKGFPQFKKQISEEIIREEWKSVTSVMFPLINGRRDKLCIQEQVSALYYDSVFLGPQSTKAQRVLCKHYDKDCGVRRGGNELHHKKH